MGFTWKPAKVLRRSGVHGHASFISASAVVMELQSGIDTSSATGRDQQVARYGAVLDLAVSKIQRSLPELIEAPASWGFDAKGIYADRDEGFFQIDNWTTSFFTGMALLAYRRTGDAQLLSRVEALSEFYRDKVGKHGADTMHDLGFLFSLYSVGLYRLTGKDEHRQTGLKAARLLADRFIAEGSYIRAWGRMDESGTDYCGLAIVDSLMNLPLLYWAAKESGEDRFSDIAVSHANTTLKHFLRPDGSVFHAYRFDPQTGEPLGGDNYCGRGVDSHWARGSAWAMYGFALSYRHTADIRFLDAALSVASTFVSKLDEEVVPVWDFSLEDGDEPLCDSSAAAIAVCAIQELEEHEASSAELSAAKSAMLQALCSKNYLDDASSCRGLLRAGQVGAGPGVARSVYTSWGDYFFMQALAHECGQSLDCW